METEPAVEESECFQLFLNFLRGMETASEGIAVNPCYDLPKLP